MDIKERYELAVIVSRLDEIEKRLDGILQRLQDQDRDMIGLCKSSFEQDMRTDDIVQKMIELGLWKGDDLK